MTNQPPFCPCGSNISYQTCCQPLHSSDVMAINAEQLMRSRYSAFCMGNIDYLIATLHPNHRQTDDAAILKYTIDQTHWLGLKILRHQPSGNTATVEFVAFYQDAPTGQLHERSNFINVQEQWFYVDGEQLTPLKLSRNDPCFCGSGKKIKKCHAI